MLKASFDLPKLARSLKKASRVFGDTTAQACARWGVQTCREMAKQTQVWGASKTRQKQEGAMFADALNVIYVTTNGKRLKSSRRLKSPEEVNDWIESNRKRKGKRTSVLPIQEKRICDYALLKKALKLRGKLAGIAKGGWIGSGQEIAAKQTGTDRINIGKNYLSYAQKHADFGEAKLVKSLFSPHASLRNKARHTASSYVIKKTAIKEAVFFGAKKTLNWYNKALKAKLDKA